MDEEQTQIKALDGTIKDIKVIDFCQVLGASINRDENRIKRVRPVTFRPINTTNSPNYKLYFASDLTSISELPINLELTLRIETT